MYRAIEIIGDPSKVIGYVNSSERLDFNQIPFATRNQGKLKEISRLLGVDVRGVDLKVPEIQPNNPNDWETVLDDKAIQAWRLNNGQPVIVEDTSLDVPGYEGLPGVYVDAFTNTPRKRQILARVVNDAGDPRAIMRIAIGLFDGTKVHKWVGETHGIITEPRGARDFGFGDIFQPDDGDGRTFGEMDPEEKDRLSPRALAVKMMQGDAANINLGFPVYMLPEPEILYTDAVDKTLFTERRAMRFARSLRDLEGVSVSEDGNVTGYSPEFIEEDIGNGIRRYAGKNDGADLGLVITPIDIAVDIHDKPYRLQVDNRKRPVFWTMGPEALRMVFASRAEEFLLYHNEEMYEYLRKIRSGEIPHVRRGNIRNPVIERLLQIQESGEAQMASSTLEFGYTRRSTDQKLTRHVLEGLITNASGLPTSVFTVGGMPPVSGSRDVIVTAAMAYSSVYIPRNSLFCPDRQIKILKESFELIDTFELPDDINDIVKRQVGVSLGVDNPVKVLEHAEELYRGGCRLFRIYTTNPDNRTIEVARGLREKFGNDIRICVGPLVDFVQAKRLIQEDVRADILLAGHGGGENCTSLEGGAASNALELLYLMNLDPDFNNTAIGLEGGTGDKIGQILPMLDVISLNRRALAAGAESGLLWVEHTNGRVAKPYWGSASPATQWVEEVVGKTTGQPAGRTRPSGRLYVVEGKVNYMVKPRHKRSMVDPMNDARILAGRTIADQGAHNLAELREMYNQGLLHDRLVSPGADFIAGPHRGRN